MGPAAENELSDYLLGPGRTGFRPRPDDDIGIAELERVPTRRVHVMILHLG